MKKMKILLTALLAIVMVFSFVGCTTDTGEQATNVTVKWNVNGATGVKADWVGKAASFAENNVPTSSGLTYDGFEFKGWAVSATATVALANAAIVTAVKDEGVREFFAVWEDTSLPNQLIAGKTEKPTKPTDTREAAYSVKSGTNNEVYAEFASLYDAINFVVDEGDLNDYVTKKSGADSDVKLFSFKERFATDTKDMFYYYTEGNRLNTFTAWEETYWANMKGLGNSTVFLSGEGKGLRQDDSPNGYNTAGVNTKVASASTVQTWNVHWQVASSVIYNLDAYSGITKAEYTVDLTKAKIYPSLNSAQKALPVLEYTIADGYYNTHIGMIMDTDTGNWYYFNGEYQFQSEIKRNIEKPDDGKVLMTSTWNAEEGYWVPDENVSLTAEILTLPDDFGDNYIVDRLTMDFSSGRKVVRDYELASLTECGTIRFTAILDIDAPLGYIQDYMCGARFENIVVTKAVATVYEEMFDRANYGNQSATMEEAGEYNILITNEDEFKGDGTDARYQVILYNSGFIATDFSGNNDVFSFGFVANPDNPAFSAKLLAFVEQLKDLPDPATLSTAVSDTIKSEIVEAKNMYVQGLSSFEKNTYRESGSGQAGTERREEFDNLVKKLSDCLVAIGQLAIPGV